MFRLCDIPRGKSAGHVRIMPLVTSFVMCEQLSMNIKQYRKSRGLSMRDFAAALDIKSAGYLCDIERANRCSPKLALAIEAHSGGLVDAATLNDDVAAVRKVAA
jgi:DNA-binding XRE family transcriptional regulator